MYLIYSLEDDLNISKIINKTLTKQGYEVVSFEKGMDFLYEFNQKKPDLVLLDMMLPDIDGIDILKKIRSDEANSDIDIIILSARTISIEKVEGLDLGADDYIEKPFDILELMSRVNARLRKHKRKDVLYSHDIYVDLSSHEVKKGDDIIKLTNREFAILVYLLKNKGSVVRREELLKNIWGVNDMVLESRTIDMHITSLRKKLNLSDNLIETVYGIGYKIRA